MKVGVLTTSRADWSIYRPLLKGFKKDDDVAVVIFVLGMHLSAHYGRTVDAIDRDLGVLVLGEDTLVYGDSKEGVAQSMGETTRVMANLLAKTPVDVLLCLGDRFEMFGAVGAAVPFNIPIAHLHGGEITEGAIDEKFRHAITKLSDIHFTSCEDHARRVRQLGAPPSRVFNIGALGIENMTESESLSIDEIKNKYGVDLSQPTLLATYQPVTTEPEKSEYVIGEFLSALEESKWQVVFTLGNADTRGTLFRRRIQACADKNKGRFYVFDSLGPVGYPSFVKHCRVVVGNSSSGIIEIASFSKPVVNIGNRQKGRAASANVIHSAEDAPSILVALKRAAEMRGPFRNIYEKKGGVQIAIRALKALVPEGPVTTFYNFSEAA